MKKGGFVTANVSMYGFPRQGIVQKIQNNRLIIVGESGRKYVCYKNATVVPDENLWGSTKEFVRRWRKKYCVHSEVIE